MIAAVRRGLVHGIILAAYALLGYLIAFTVMGGRV
jgi:uncharacterized membrane protein required for colicin V production